MKEPKYEMYCKEHAFVNFDLEIQFIKIFVDLLHSKYSIKLFYCRTSEQVKVLPLHQY